jgi:hypothetical protein
MENPEKGSILEETMGEQEANMVENVEALIRKDKRIILPLDAPEVDENIKNILLNNIGTFWSEGADNYNFIDKDGNLATFNLFSSKMKNGVDVTGQLESLGFKPVPSWDDIPVMLHPALKARMKADEAESPKKKFDL